ncbi:MAG: chromate efflux transporter [Thermodesulfovibrionales bacterium]|nr:chromate efflux transporter [Thermodesulfovibrionales bacterium]
MPPSLLQIFLAFFRLGFISFGGPAMIQYINQTVVKDKKWLNHDEFTKGLVICQSLPGAIVVNTSAYYGYQLRGLKGMLLGFSAFLMPSFLIMLMFSMSYKVSQNLKIVMSIFQGLEVVVVAIVINACVRFCLDRLAKSIKGYVLALIYAGLLFSGVNPLFVIMLSAILGILLYKESPSTQNIKAHRDVPLSHIIFIAFVVFVFYVAMFVIDAKILELSFTMTKIALMSFGGVYTALPIMYHEVVETKMWLNSKTFMDGIALGQVTPGPVLINATFVGYNIAGLLGAFAATFAIFAPGPLLVLVMMPLFNKIATSRYFISSTKGMVVAFAGLLMFVSVKFGIAVSWDVVKIVFLMCSLIWLAFKNNVVTLALVGTVLSAVIF